MCFIHVFVSLHFTQFSNDFSRWMQIEAQWRCETNQNTQGKKCVFFCPMERSWILTTSWMRNSNWVLRLSMICLWFFLSTGSYKYDCHKFQRLINGIKMKLCKTICKAQRISWNEITFNVRIIYRFVSIIKDSFTISIQLSRIVFNFEFDFVQTIIRPQSV